MQEKTHRTVSDKAERFPFAIPAGKNTDVRNGQAERQRLPVGGTQAATGRFRIIRNYRAGTHTKAGDTTMHITTGTVEKRNAPPPP